MLNLFPYTNLHSLNLDWIIRRIKAAVFSVNGYTPDENGNVQLPTVPTVSSVNGQQGAVVLDAADVGAIPDTVTVPTLTSQLVNDSGYITAAQAGAVSSVNGEVGDVVLDAADVGATPAGQGIPSGGVAYDLLMKRSSTDYDAEFGVPPTVKGTVSKVSGNSFTLNAGTFEQHMGTVLLDINFHCTATIANGATLGVISGAPAIDAQSVPPTVFCWDGNGNNHAGIRITNDGNGNISLIASGPIPTSTYYVACFVYFSV